MTAKMIDADPQGVGRQTPDGADRAGVVALLRRWVGPIASIALLAFERLPADTAGIESLGGH